MTGLVKCKAPGCELGASPRRFSLCYVHMHEAAVLAIAALTDCADHIEDLYRMSAPFVTDKKLDSMVRSHRILAPARAAIAAFVGAKKRSKR